ncbi:hypothetical protein [Massilia sp. H6]|uniref:hypothetical protein n=1 Tax=Massilia sp. H6 TaxID=2970464 RepID=UPI002167BE22|nr:hypothetical protein [Massilia sp. H6]UVW30679.1 hypothetical protein NRS07_20170 [Massilia sp. H6]
MKLGLLMCGLILIIPIGSVRASDHGCTVLLCMANPAGPMAVMECVPPIKKLFRDLARGKAFPKCDMASAPDAPGGKSWVQHGTSFYDQCPAGTTALDAGTYAVRQGVSASYYLGIGEGDDPYGEDAGALRNKVCVGNRVGETTLAVGNSDGTAALPASVFDQVVVIAPSPQPHHVDVYVNSTFSHRVRW